MTYSILAVEAGPLTVKLEWMEEDDDQEERGLSEISGNVPLQQEGSAGEEDVKAEREERVVVPVAVTKKVTSTVSMGSADPIPAVVGGDLGSHDKVTETETER